jgi:hypothetical protein
MPAPTPTGGTKADIPGSPSRADAVEKRFFSSERARLIQDQAQVRNVDSKNHFSRFDCYIFLFHSFRAVTFSTASTHRVGSLRRTDSVAIEGTADIGEASLPVGATRMTQPRHWAAQLAVMHNAVFPITLW